MLQAFFKRVATFLGLPGIASRAYRKGQQEERARVVRLLRERAEYLDARGWNNTSPALRDLADKIEGC